MTNMLSRIDQLELRLADLESGRPTLNSIEPHGIYKVAQVARLLSCSQTNVYDLLKARSLASTRIGAGDKGLRIIGSDILAFLQSRKSGGPRPSLVDELRNESGKPSR
jgi:hypothetical protein